MTIIIKSCDCADVHDDYLPLLKICDLSVCWGYYTPFWNACQGFLRIFENLGVIFVFFMGFMHGFHGGIGILCKITAEGEEEGGDCANKDF
jgi:hypothetical protein